MLTGNPPLSHFKPERAALKIVSETFDIVSTLSLNVSYDAKGFITAALTWLVSLIAELKKWLVKECI